MNRSCLDALKQAHRCAPSPYRPPSTHALTAAWLVDNGYLERAQIVGFHVTPLGKRVIASTKAAPDMQSVLDALGTTQATSSEIATALEWTVVRTCNCLTRLERHHSVKRVGTKHGNGRPSVIWEAA